MRTEGPLGFRVWGCFRCPKIIRIGFWRIMLYHNEKKDTQNRILVIKAPTSCSEVDKKDVFLIMGFGL